MVEEQTGTRSISCDTIVGKNRIWLRYLSIPLYFAFCLTVAGLIRLNVVPRIALLGLCLGFSAFLTVWAGLCFRSVWLGIASASLMATAVFGTFLYLAGTQDFIPIFAYSCNFPLMALSAVTPFLVIRWMGKRLSLEEAIESRVTWTMESILHWTAIIACTIYFARVPILLHGLDWRSLAVFLPALVATSLVTSLIVAVPSIWLPFRTNTKWWSLVINLAVSAILFAGLMPIAIWILKSWQRVIVRNTEDQILGVACCLIIYQLGLLALHLRGYRWKHLIVIDPRNDSRTQYKFNYSLRWLTGVSIVLAVLTKFGVQLYENKQQESTQKVLDLIEEVRADGADVVLSVSPNQPFYPENQIIQLSMTASNFEKVIPKLPQPLRPNTLQLEGMTEEQLSYVIRNIDNIFSLNLKNCQLTATNFTEFDKFPKIFAIQIEGCQFSFDDSSMRI